MSSLDLLYLVAILLVVAEIKVLLPISLGYLLALLARARLLCGALSDVIGCTGRSSGLPSSLFSSEEELCTLITGDTLTLLLVVRLAKILRSLLLLEPGAGRVLLPAACWRQF